MYEAPSRSRPIETKGRTMISTSLLCLALLATPPAEPVDEVDSVVVLPIKLAKGIDQKTGDLLNEVVVSELAKVAPKGVRVIGSSDVQTLISHDKQTVSLGCDDTGCLVEIGQALGASHLLQLSLGLIGDKYVINSKFLLVSEATVPYRNVRYVVAKEDALLEGVRAVVADLARARAWKLPPKKSPEISVASTNKTQQSRAIAKTSTKLSAPK